MSIQYEQCQRCGIYFDPRRNIGQWECRMHAMPEPHPEFATTHDYRYECCGMLTRRAFYAAIAAVAPIARDSIDGCLRVDHQGPNDKPRAQTDLILFADYNQAHIAPHAPKERLQLMFPITLGHLRDTDTFKGVLNMKIRVAAPPKSKVVKNLGPVLDALICEAYSDPVFLSMPENKSAYERILALKYNQAVVPDLEFPEGRDETNFVGMSDDAFVSFHLIHSKTYRSAMNVRIMVVRRADNEMDDNVLSDVKKDKEYS